MYFQKLSKIILILLISHITLAQKKEKVVFPSRVLGDGYPEYINPCELPNHKSELVYTRFIYSGVDEYWSLTAPDKKCSVNASLELPNGIILNLKDEKALRDVISHYWKRYLIIDVIGTYNDNNKEGYGHLGSNSAVFTVKKVIDTQVMVKR